MKKNNVILKRNIFTFLALITILCNSCRKEEGLGGNSAIRGKLELQNYNKDFSILKEQKAYVNEYVYITYGNVPGSADRVRTSYDGSFSFTHLRKGKYTVYAYSKDVTKKNSGDIAIIKEIEIKKNKEDVDAGVIVVADNKITGNATIYGKVLMKNYTDNTEFYKANQWVYIVYDNGVKYEHDIRTNYNGEYLFSNLPIGKYKVYTYSSDVFNTSNDVIFAVIKETEINSVDQNDTIPDLRIFMK